MKSIARYLLQAIAVAVSSVSSAATLNWTLPTTRGNGEALAAADIEAIRVYRAGAIIVTLPGTATAYPVPSCKPDAYAVTALASGLESAPSNTAEVAI